MHKYLVMIWDQTDPRTAPRTASIQLALQKATAPWQTAYSTNGVLAMYQRAASPSFRIYPLANHAGVILGSLFRRGSPDDASMSPDASIDPSESASIIQSKGRHLVEKYWGSYVAIISNVSPPVCGLLRSPTGTLPCYHAALDNIHVFFSDMDDIRHCLPIPLSINWTHVAARLLTGFRYSRECSVKEVEDVIGGEWISISGACQRRVPLWQPAQFCVDSHFEDEETAERALRSTVVNVTHTLAAQHSHILLRLSGGLDSSIVATCLAQQSHGPHVTCLNFFITDDYGDEAKNPLPPGLTSENMAKLRRVIGSADERAFARIVASKCGFGLVERQKRARDVKLRRIEDAPLVPRPSHFAFMTVEDEAESELAASTGASACFGGEAGDTVFYNTQRAIGALDYAYLHPFSTEVLRQIRTTSILSRESYSRVLWKVVKHSLLQIKLPEPYDVMNRPHLLRDEAAEEVKRTLKSRHPWTDISQPLCPGKKEHALSVTNYIAAYPHALHADRVAPPIHPLASQPVVELCLRIPTYVLLAGGVSRGLARRAFRDRLPTEVVRRTVKGGTVGFLQDTVRHNLGYIRERLFDGILVRQRLLDRRKLESFFVAEQPFLTVNAIQVMDYLACENWLGQMSSIN